MLRAATVVKRNGPRHVPDLVAPIAAQARRLLAQLIAERRAAGDSFGCIAHGLNQCMVPAEHGGRWYASSVRKFFLRTQAEARCPDAFTLTGSGSGNIDVIT